MGVGRVERVDLRAPLRPLLAAALGDSNSLVHALVYTPTQRRHQAEAAAALEFAQKAGAARLKPGVYAGSHSKGLISQLQAVLAALDSPGEEMRLEMRGQMVPDDEALERLRDEVLKRRAALAEQGQAQPEAELEAARQANARAREAAAAERAEVEADTARLHEQITGVKSGEKLQEAMNTLKNSIQEEKAALKRQLDEMAQRHEKAKAALAASADGAARVTSAGPNSAQALTAMAATYKARGMAKPASLLYMSAVKLLDSVGQGRSAAVVGPLSELADLYSLERMEEEAIALYKQAYSIEKDVSGSDSPKLSLHLQKLGGADDGLSRLIICAFSCSLEGSSLAAARAACARCQIDKKAFEGTRQRTSWRP